MAQTTSLVFNGGVIPSPSPAPTGSGKAKLLKIGEITVTEQEVQVTKKVICDPDSVTTVAPFMEVLTSAKLAELISANSILVLDDGTVQYLMADATVVVEDGTAVCTSVSFLGLSLEDRAKVLYPCTRITDELTLQQVLEVGEPVETGFDLVKAEPEDMEAGTLIDKLIVEDTVQGPDDQTLLEVVPSEDGEGNAKVAINENNLRNNIDGIYNALDGIIDTLDEMDFDSVPRTYLHSSLNQSAGDSVTTRTTIDTFAVDALESECFEFEETTTIDDVPFGYVWIEPGTYLINASVTLQWVGNPRGTFIAKVGSVMGENFDFSQEQEISCQSTKVVTIPNRMKLAVNVTYDAGTPVMGFWIQSMQVVKLAGGMSQTTVTHGLSLKGNGSVENPLDISEHGLREAFDYAKNKNYFATKQEIAPLATQASVQAETARATQRENEIEALFTLPTQEAVDTWLEAHPEATTTVEDHSLTGNKLVLGTLNFVTPEMFGAVGDGVTDDSDAIIAMLANGNVKCLFRAGSTYKVTKAINYFSNTFIDFNCCTIRSYFNGNVFVQQTTSENRQSNVIFKNGCIIGNGEDGNVGDIGAGILGWNVDNIYIENMQFSHTWGDGMLFRTCKNVTIINCTCELYGRNGISPISGSFYIDNLTIKSRSLTGANPGIPFDCEPERNETCKLIIKNSTISGAVFVSFYVNEGDDFKIELLLDNCTIGEYFPSLWITSGDNKTIAKNIKVKNCRISALPASTGFSITNVAGICVEDCYFSSSNSSATNTHCIGSFHCDGLSSLTIKNCKSDAWGSGNAKIFAYGALIQNLELNGIHGWDIYCKNIKNSKISNCSVPSCAITDGTDSGNIEVFNSYVSDSIAALAEFGGPDGNFQASTVVSRVIEYSDYTGTKDVNIPLPNKKATRGRCFLISIGYSHRGYTSNSGFVLASVFCGGTTDSREVINVLASSGDKTISLAADPNGVGIVATFAANFIGTISYTILG